METGKTPEGSAPGIAGFVHRAIRKVNGVSRSALDIALRRFSSQLDTMAPPGPNREAIIAALNGVCGDHLARTGNPLAMQMRLRVGLPGEADCSRKPGRRLLIAVHGLSMNDREWTWQNHNHIETLARQQGFTPVYVTYNSGKHISWNGQELSAALAALVASWPGPVQSITFVGFSMGGLVARSAMHVAQEEAQGWLERVDKAVYIGTPHHGAVMERGVSGCRNCSPTAPIPRHLRCLAEFVATALPICVTATCATTTGNITTHTATTPTTGSPRRCRGKSSTLPSPQPCQKNPGSELADCWATASYIPRAQREGTATRSTILPCNPTTRGFCMTSVTWQCCAIDGSRIS